MVKAFSLIELLVVIAIVAILAAIAVPNYVSYTNRVKVVEALNLMTATVDYMRLYYDQHGEFPPYYLNLVKVADTTLSYGQGTQINVGNVDSVSYYYPLNVNTGLYGVVFAVQVSGLADIPAFINGSALTMGLKVGSGGVIEQACGGYTAGDPGNIPVGDLPSSCTCGSVYTWVSQDMC